MKTLGPPGPCSVLRAGHYPRTGVSGGRVVPISDFKGWQV